MNTLLPKVDSNTKVQAARNNRENHPPPPEISTDDLSKAVKRMESRNSAPGRDGVPSNVLVISYDTLHEKVI